MQRRRRRSAADAIEEQESNAFSGLRPVRVHVVAGLGALGVTSDATTLDVDLILARQVHDRNSIDQRKRELGLFRIEIAVTQDRGAAVLWMMHEARREPAQEVPWIRRDLELFAVALDDRIVGRHELG